MKSTEPPEAEKHSKAIFLKKIWRKTPRNFFHTHFHLPENQLLWQLRSQYAVHLSQILTKDKEKISDQRMEGNLKWHDQAKLQKLGDNGRLHGGKVDGG